MVIRMGTDWHAGQHSLIRGRHRWREVRAALQARNPTARLSEADQHRDCGKILNLGSQRANLTGRPNVAPET